MYARANRTYTHTLTFERGQTLANTHTHTHTHTHKQNPPSTNFPHLTILIGRFQKHFTVWRMRKARNPGSLTLACNIYIKVKVKLATVVDGDQKAPFSITTTPRYRGGRYSFLLDCSTLPLIRTLHCWVLSMEVSSIILKVFGMTWPGIEPWSHGPLANTLLTKPMSWFWKKFLHGQERVY